MMNILIIDDEQRVVSEIIEFLSRLGHKVQGVNTIEESQTLLQIHSFDLLLLDVRLAKMSGIEYLQIIKPQYPEMEVIIMSGHGDMDTVIEAMRAGAADYLKKPFRHKDLQISMERANKLRTMNKDIIQLKEDKALISQELEQVIGHQLIGESREIKEVLQMALKAAEYNDLPVLITGESGTGKEIIARIIHHSSNRKKHNFLGVNCSALPENMMESEFFGYRKGAFTGAFTDRKGFLESASHGTLFMDEIADMPKNMQAKLLRALEEKSIIKLGTDKAIPINVRIISATNHNIHDKIDRSEFRLDLFHRINTIQIDIPPLRERKSDIPVLINHFVQQFCHQYGKPVPSITKETLNHLTNYSYPGNIRELKNMVERALILNKEPSIHPDLFPILKSTQTIDETDYTLSENEAVLIENVLKQFQGNQTKAAEKLGISRFTLMRKLKKYGINE